MAPQTFVIDYNTEGAWESATNWATFDDNNYLIQAKPHELVADARSPFEVNPEYTSKYNDFKLAYSWEKADTNFMPGKL